MQEQGKPRTLAQIKAARKHRSRTFNFKNQDVWIFCKNGIACVIYPEARWYRLNDSINIQSLIEHLKEGETLSDLLMQFDEK